MNNKITIRAENWIKDTRIRYCGAYSCRHRKDDSFDCNLKEISIDNEGKCELFECIEDKQGEDK